MGVDLERLLLKQAQDWRAIALGHQARAEAALAELARLQKVAAGRIMSDADSALAVEASRAKTLDGGNTCGGCAKLRLTGSGHFACDESRSPRLLISTDSPACRYFSQMQPPSAGNNLAAAGPDAGGTR